MRKIIVFLSIVSILICCAFTVSADNGPTIAVNGNKVVVADTNVNNTNHRIILFYLGDKTVDNPMDWDSCAVIDSKYSVYYGLDVINAVELTKAGNYVIRLLYSDEANVTQVVAYAFSIFPNNYFDFDDYATYQFLDDNTVCATVSLPFEYYTCVDNNLGELLYFRGKSFSFYTSDWFLFSTNPFFEYYYNYDINNPEPPSTFTNGNFFDLDLLPKEFVLTNSFRVDFFGENYHWFESGQAYFVFVDSQGNYLGHNTVSPKLDEHDTYSICNFTFDSTFYSIPENAKGFFVCYALSGNLNTGTTGNMTISYSSMTFDFDLDDAFVNWKNEEIVRESISNIENSLDEIVNGEVTPEKSPVDDSINDMLDKEDELLQDTEKGFEDVLTYITQAISELVAYATAFVAISGILDGFFALPIIGPLITISLALGIFALIVNLGQAVDRVDRANKAKVSKGGKG